MLLDSHSYSLRRRHLLCVVIAGLTALQGMANAEERETSPQRLKARFESDVAPLLTSYCGKCHGNQLMEAEIDLVAVSNWSQAKRQTRLWMRVRRILASRQMPPPESPQPSDRERETMRRWVRDMLANEARARDGDPGQVPLRRLSNDEYQYAVRDLTGSPLNPTREFPVDAAAGEGFTNVGSGQGMSPALMRKYLDAGKRVAQHAVLLDGGFRFGEATTRRDKTDAILSQIQRLYSRYSIDSEATTSLHGIQVRAHEDGLLPLRRYLRVLFQQRAAVEANATTWAHEARARGLSVPYLQRLAKTLLAKEPHSNWLLDQIRTDTLSADATEFERLAGRIAGIQKALWKFNAIGHVGREGGPSVWQEPVNPLVRRQEIVAPLNRLATEENVTLELSAFAHLRPDSAAARRSQNGLTRLALRAPRLRFAASKSGWRPPEIPLHRVGAIAATTEATMAAQFARTADYLAAVEFVHRSRASLTDVARERQLDARLLTAWNELLRLERDQPRTITGRFSKRLRNVQNQPAVNGWGSQATPNLLANSSEKAARFLTLEVPARGVTVHPSPTHDAIVAWRSPASGLFSISGFAADADSVCGNGVACRLELRNADGIQVLWRDTLDNGGRAELQLDAPLSIEKDDVLLFIVGAKDRNHVCDTTQIAWTIQRKDGERQKWNLAADIVDKVLDDNPLPDAYGGKAVWHFCASPNASSAGKKTANPIPAQSSLAKWRNAVRRGRDVSQLQELAEAVQASLVRETSAADGAEHELRNHLRSWNGPLKWSRLVLSPAAEDALKLSSSAKFGPPIELFQKEPNEPASAEAPSLVMAAPGSVSIPLPRWMAEGAALVSTAELVDSEDAAAVQLRIGSSAAQAWFDPASPVLIAHADAAAARQISILDQFRELFPRALCYRRIVPVDEVVTLTLYHREDEPLKRLMLSASEAEQLDQLWEDLAYVSQEPLQRVVVLEQIKEFATQDRPDLVKAFAPLGPKFAAAAAAFRQRQLAAEPKHVQAALDFAARAWRRPLSDGEKRQLRSLYSQLRSESIPHAEAVRLVLARILTSPAFLFKLETAPTGSEPAPVSSHELASRLSFFLWSSIPDRDLRRAALNPSLQTDEAIRAQTRRMLKDERSERLAIQFAAQWLHLRDFDRNNDKNERKYPEFARLRADMYRELLEFFSDMIRNNGSILDIIKADHTFLNAALAEHYGIPFPSTAAPQSWRRIEGIRSHGRGGVLGMATFLASQSGASRTSPILRGNWIFETLLGERLPRPPANVPQLPNEPPQSLTTRQLIEKHSGVAACAKCHQHIDPLGFALEQYDAIGRRRERPVDTKTTLLNGTKIEGLEDLREYLARERRDAIVNQFCRKLLGFALGREVQLSDEPLLERIKRRLEADSYRFHTAVEVIVLSPQFRNIRGDANDASP